MKSRKTGDIPGRLANLVLVLAALALLLAPCLLQGHAALQWARYHAQRASLSWLKSQGARPAEHARQAARAAVSGLDLLAPLPQATRGVRVALDLCRRLETRDRAAALAVAREVRGGLERVRASRLRGFGLGPLADEARALEEQLLAPAGEARP